MKKCLIVLLFLVGFSFSAKAQNLETKIPGNSEIVVVTNGDRLFELVSLAEFNNSFLGKNMLKSINRKREEKVTSVADLGIDVNSKAYYFMQNTDSVTYNNMFAKLKDRAAFEATFNKYDRESIKRENGFNILVDYSSVTVWNDNLMLLVNASRSNSYFREHRDRLMQQSEGEDDTEYDVFKKIEQNWAVDYAKSILKGVSARTISSNSSYQSAKKKGAAATIWVRNYGEIIGKMLSSFGGMYSSMDMFRGEKNFYGIEEVTGSLFFNENDAKLNLDMTVASNMQKSYKKMYNQKINSAFFNHFDQEKALAFWSLSFNTKGMFEEYPNLLKNIYGGMMPRMKEEIEVVADLFGLLIDEEAIGNLITGDMLFVLDGMGQRDVEFTTYEYDEDYNRKEVTKTKKEFVPDFTLMIGSKEKKLLNKIYRLGVKHNVINADAGVFEFVIPSNELPFPLYSVTKNDILFLTTSKVKANNIISNRTISSSGKHKKLIRKSTSVMYVNGKEIIAKLPEGQLSPKEIEMANLFSDSLKELYFTSSRLKGNKISSELKVNTSGKDGNSLKLLLNLIEELSKR